MKKIRKQIRALSGNDIKVLLVIRLIGGFDVGNKQIKEWTKLSYPTIANCLEALRLENLVTHIKRTNGWQLTALGSKVLLGNSSERILHSPHSNSRLESLTILKDKELKPTITIEASTKSFDSSPEVKNYLKVKGVWPNVINEIAEIANNDLDFLKNYFEGTDTALALYRIRNEIPPSPPENNTSYLCIDCYESICICES
jgi:hypothetical protein